MSQQQTNELEEAIEKLKQEVEIEVILPNGNTEKMYYDFSKLNYKQIESTKLALLIWDQKFRNLPNTLPTMQQTFFEEAGARGMAMMLYTKDKDNNPVPYKGEINNHRPYELLNYTTGEQYEMLNMCRNFFLSKWGVTSHDFKTEFLNTTDLLLSSQMEKIQELIAAQIKQKGFSKKKQEEMEKAMSAILNNSFNNILQADSSEQSVPDSDIEEMKST